MLVPKGAKCYRADNGSLLIIGEQEVLYSPDGENFFELQGGSGHYSGDYRNVKYVDIRDGTEYEIDVNATRVNGKLYKPTVAPTEIHFVPLPEIRKPEYLFFGPDVIVIYVSADLHHYSYESFRFFIGTLDKPGELREVRITDVGRLRDGGTTHIYTKEGVLYSPSPFKKGEAATWTPNGGASVKLKTVTNPEAFKITENADGAQIGRPDVTFIAK